MSETDIRFSTACLHPQRSLRRIPSSRPSLLTLSPEKGRPFPLSTFPLSMRSSYGSKAEPKLSIFVQGF